MSTTPARALLLLGAVVVTLLVLWTLLHRHLPLPPSPDFAAVRGDKRYQRGLKLLALRRKLRRRPPPEAAPEAPLPPAAPPAPGAAERFPFRAPAAGRAPAGRFLRAVHRLKSSTRPLAR